MTSDPLTPSRLIQELSQSEGEEQMEAEAPWVDSKAGRNERPSSGLEQNTEAAIQPTAAEISDTPPPSTRGEENQIPRFIKCPKCGHVAQSADDWLITNGECPTCGLLAAKFTKTYMAHPPKRLRRPGSFVAQLIGTIQASDESPYQPDVEAEHDEYHWLAFWTKPDWLAFFAGSLFLSLLCASLPPFLYLVEAYTVESQRLSALNLAATGVLVWAVALVGMVACFYCYSLWTRDRRIFLIHVCASLGVCAILALVGAVLSKVIRATFHLTDRLRLEAALTPARILAGPVLLFLALVLYLGLIRLPAERNLIGYLDGTQYAAKVQDARALAGPDFPNGTHEKAYQYYKYVYVDTSKNGNQSFDKVIRRLVTDHYPGSFNHQHSTDATLLVMNAIGFRDDLAKQGLISDQTYARLSELAYLWGKTGHWKGAASDPVRRFDAQCPITRGELGSLEEKITPRRRPGTGKL